MSEKMLRKILTVRSGNSPVNDIENRLQVERGEVCTVVARRTAHIDQNLRAGTDQWGLLAAHGVLLINHATNK